MRSRTRASGLLAALLLTACGAAGDGDDLQALPDEPAVSDGAGGGGAAGTCPEGTEDCVDADLGGDGAPPDELPGDLDVDAARAEAQELLGMTEEEALARGDDVRLGRRGDEQFALTEDFRPGRKTIATEDDGTGTFRVVEVEVELDEGTETFTES
jgi:hypothetical protein